MFIEPACTHLKMAAYTPAGSRDVTPTSCVHCGKESNSPYLLPCLHVVCEQCVHSPQATEGDRIECTSCGDCSASGLKLSENAYSNCESPCTPFHCPSLAQSISASTREKYNMVCRGQIVLCSLKSCTSSQQEACYMCLDCKDFLCVGCYTIHQVMAQKFNSPHVVKPLKELAGMSLAEFHKIVSGDKVTPCTRHKDKEIKYFCTSCDALFCEVCTVEIQAEKDHLQFHQLKYLSEENTKHYVHSLKMAEAVIEDRVVKCRSVKHEANTLATALGTCTDQVLQEIDEQFKLLHWAVDVRKSEVVKSVRESLSSRTKVLQGVIDSLESEQGDLLRSQNLLGKLLSEGGISEVVSCAKAAALKQESLVSKPLKAPHTDLTSLGMKFEPCNSDSVLEAVKGFGVVVCGPDPTESSVSSLPRQVHIGDSVSLTAHICLTAIGDNGHPWKKGGDKVEAYLRPTPPGVGPSVKANVDDNKDGTYLISFSDVYCGLCTVSVSLNSTPVKGSPFDVEFRKSVICSLSRNPCKLSMVKNYLPFPHSPGGLHGIAVSTETGDIYVVDNGHHCIHIFDRNRKFIRSFGSHGNGHGQLRSPNGMTIDLHNQIYVANCDNDRIEVFKPDGTYVGRIGKTRLAHPTDVAIHDKCLYVADSGKHRIVKFTLQGKFVSSFGDQSGVPSLFQWPSGLVVSETGELFVTDCNQSRVVVINAEGKFLREFGRGVLRNPLDILLVENGSILVNDTGCNRIVVFDAISGEIQHTVPVSSPYGLAVDSQGDLLVTDFSNKRVAIF